MSHERPMRNHLDFCVLVGDMIFNNANVDIRDTTGNTPLHLAVIKLEHTDITTKLLDKGADIHARNYHDYTPLDLAIQNEKINAATLLIKRGTLVGEDLSSLILTAIEKNNDRIVKMIVDYGMKDNPSMNLIICLKDAISKQNSAMIEAIIPYCCFSKRSDRYISKNLVVKSDEHCKKCVRLLLKWNFTIHPDSHYDGDFIYGAVENGYLPIVVQLLDLGIDVNMVNSKTDLNLLTIACLNKHHEIVEILLKHNADVNVKISSKNEILSNHSCFERNISQFTNLFSLNNRKNDLIDVTCLHIAVFNSDSITTDILLRSSAKKTDNAEFFNLTCIAIKNTCKKIVGTFLDHFVKVTDVHPTGNTLLDFCFYFHSYYRDDHYDVVKLLVERGANIHLKTPGNEFVFNAINNEDYKTAQLFLDWNTNVQYISRDGETSLHKAIKKYFNAKFIKTLLKLNSPVNTVDRYGNSPLLDACRINTTHRLEIVKALLLCDADVNFSDGCLKTPLHVASYGEDPQVVEVLLHKGANLHAVNERRQTPLHFACQNNSWRNISIIKLLLKHGANIEAVDVRGWTPLFIAYEDRNYRAVQCLLDHHANPNHTTLSNSTLFDIAIEQTSLSTRILLENQRPIQFLIRYGANVNVLDRNNQTPLHNAIQKMLYYSNNDLGHRPFIYRSCEEIVKILVSQAIKLKTAGLEVNNYNSNVVFNPDDYITIDNIRYSANDILQLNVESNNNDVANRDDGVSDDEDSIGDLRTLKARCEQEIQKMKKESIGIDDLTFYDLLEANIYRLGGFFENDEIQQTLTTKVYDKEFPLYIDIVRNQLRDAKIRYEHYMLRISAREYFTLNINEQVPDECVDVILNYLNIEEIKKFIKTMDPSDV